MKINICGIYPAPYGGISIHIKRMNEFLILNDYEVVVYNEGKTKVANVIPISNYKLILKYIFSKNEIFHFHSSNVKLRILVGIFKKKSNKVIFTIHGESLNEQLSGCFLSKILLGSLKRLDYIVCVNKKTIDELLKKGIKENKLKHIPAYINPIESPNDYDNLPINISEFIDSSEFLISFNGAVRFHNKSDLYGFDMIIDTFLNLNIKYNHLSLIICVLDVASMSGDEKKYYDKIRKKIDSNERVLIYEVENTEFYPILKKSKLYIRPTNTDGYAMSLAEAIYYDIPAIASNVCVRPEGTILFKNRDSSDLEDKIEFIITNYNMVFEHVKKIKVVDYKLSLRELYDYK